MNSRKMIHYLVLVSLLGLSGCARPHSEVPPPTGAPVGAMTLRIESAWSRSTAEIEAGTGIVYMSITNTGTQAETLLAAKTPIAGAVEFHIHVQDSNGVMRMRMVDGGRIEIPAGGTVILEPGGLHIMLINLAEALKSGTTYPLTLKFERSGEVTLQVPVADSAPAEAVPMQILPGSFEHQTP